MPEPGSDSVVTAPSGRALAKATLVALVVAAVVLVVAILPAEYGIDPLGAGRALGLSNFAAAEAPPETVAPAWDGPLSPQDDPFTTDTRTFTLPADGWVEFKYTLASGATMLYDWTASGPVEFDFHTEMAGKPPEAAESYEKGESTEHRGAYLAPYDGIHGWYWRNRSDQQVTVTLKATGFFSAAKLFHQDGTTEQFVLGAAR